MTQETVHLLRDVSSAIGVVDATSIGDQVHEQLVLFLVLLLQSASAYH